jgi:hypothetical protein
MPLLRLVGGRAVREANDAHSVQAVVGAHAAGAVLAGSDHGVCGAGRYRAGVVCEATLPGEDREAAGGGGQPEST